MTCLLHPHCITNINARKDAKSLCTMLLLPCLPAYMEFPNGSCICNSKDLILLYVIEKATVIKNVKREIKSPVTYAIKSMQNRMCSDQINEK